MFPKHTPPCVWQKKSTNKQGRAMLLSTTWFLSAQEWSTLSTSLHLVTFQCNITINPYLTFLSCTFSTSHLELHAFSLHTCTLAQVRISGCGVYIVARCRMAKGAQIFFIPEHCYIWTHVMLRDTAALSLSLDVFAVYTPWSSIGLSLLPN